MRQIEPKFALALLFAALTIITVIASRHAHNSYYLAAAGVLAIATYLTCPPVWMIELANLLPGGKHK